MAQRYNNYFKKGPYLQVFSLLELQQNNDFQRISLCRVQIKL